MSYINNTTVTAMWAFKDARIVKDPGGKRESQQQNRRQTDGPTDRVPFDTKCFTTSIEMELKISARTMVLYSYFLVLYLIMQVNQIPHSINPIILKETFGCLYEVTSKQTLTDIFEDRKLNKALGWEEAASDNDSHISGVPGGVSGVQQPPQQGTSMRRTPFPQRAGEMTRTTIHSLNPILRIHSVPDYE